MNGVLTNEKLTMFDLQNSIKKINSKPKLISSPSINADIEDLIINQEPNHLPVVEENVKLTGTSDNHNREYTIETPLMIENLSIERR